MVADIATSTGSLHACMQTGWDNELHPTKITSTSFSCII